MTIIDDNASRNDKLFINMFNIVSFLRLDLNAISLIKLEESKLPVYLNFPIKISNYF